MKKILLLSCVLFLFFSCEKFKRSSSETIKVEGAWARAVPPISKMSAVYMTIKNNTDKENEVMSVFSSVSKSVEMHEMAEKNGHYMMQPIKQLIVPAKGSVILEQGGKHFMLINLVTKLIEGETLSVTLKMRNGERIQVKVPIAKSKVSL